MAILLYWRVFIMCDTKPRKVTGCPLKMMLGRRYFTFLLKWSLFRHVNFIGGGYVQFRWFQLDEAILYTWERLGNHQCHPDKNGWFSGCRWELCKIVNLKGPLNAKPRKIWPRVICCPPCWITSPSNHKCWISSLPWLYGGERVRWLQSRGCFDGDL